MRIQNNITAMNTHRQYTINNDNVAKAAEKLSSGYRINRAADDAAGLAISEKMRSQIRGLNMATKNSQDAISLVQTAEGALQETHSMLQRMNELAVQAATGTNQDFDKIQAAKEFEQLKREINDVAESTTFNNMKILDGSLSYRGYQRSAATAGVTVTTANGTAASSGSGSSGRAEAAKITFNMEGFGAAKGNAAGDVIKLNLSVGGESATLTSKAIGTTQVDEKTAIAAFDGATTKIDGVTYTAKVEGKNLVLTADAAGATKLGEAKITGSSWDNGSGTAVTTGTTGGTVDKLVSNVGFVEDGKDGSSEATAASFDLDISGTFNNMAQNDTPKLTLEIDGRSQTIDGAKLEATTPAKADVVKAFDGKEIEVDGKKYTLTASEAGDKLTVTAKDAGETALKNVKFKITKADGTTDILAQTSIADAKIVQGKNASDGSAPATGATITADIGAVSVTANQKFELTTSFRDKDGNKQTLTFEATPTANVTLNAATANLELKASGDTPSGWTAKIVAGKITITGPANEDGSATTFQEGTIEISAKNNNTDVTTGAPSNAVMKNGSAEKKAAGAASASDGPTTIELDFVKMKDGDKISVNVGGKDITIERQAGDTKKTFLDRLAKSLEGNDDAQLKGNAIVVKGGVEVGTPEFAEGGDATEADPEKYATNAMRIQVGALENEQLNISIDSMNTAGLGLDAMNLNDQDAAGAAITAVRNAVNVVSDQRATLGAMQNRLDHKIANLKVSSENLSAAESRIRDVDMASEMTNFTRNNILSQAATAMLAQANALPQNVLSLLG